MVVRVTRYDYKIITTNTIEKLEYDVNQALKKGWKPQGGMSVVTMSFDNSTNGNLQLKHIKPKVFQYSQAIILETETANRKEKTYLEN